MEKYNYREQVKSDILDYIAENEIKVTASNREEVAEQLQDELWANDSVTGNASGSYTCNAWEAEENICPQFRFTQRGTRRIWVKYCRFRQRGNVRCNNTLLLTR